jgi:hypothetical protein
MANDGREEFERVISGPPYDCRVDRHTDSPDAAWPGQYKKCDVQLAWEMYQIGRSQAQRELYPVFDSLQRLWASGHVTTEQNGQWWLFDEAGEGKSYGRTFRELCVNIVLAGL